MLAKYFLIIRNYVLSVSSQRKYNFCHQNTLLDAFRTNSCNSIGRKPSMAIPLLANQDLMPMLFIIRRNSHLARVYAHWIVTLHGWSFTCDVFFALVFVRARAIARIPGHGLHYQYHPYKCFFVFMQLCVFFLTEN